MSQFEKNSRSFPGIFTRFSSGTRKIPEPATTFLSFRFSSHGVMLFACYPQQVHVWGMAPANVRGPCYSVGLSCLLCCRQTGVPNRISRNYPNQCLCAQIRISQKLLGNSDFRTLGSPFPAFCRVHAKGVVLCERACFCLLSTF